MKLILTTNDGELLDQIDVSREEWEVAQRVEYSASSLLRNLSAGSEAE